MEVDVGPEPRAGGLESGPDSNLLESLPYCASTAHLSKWSEHLPVGHCGINEAKLVTLVPNERAIPKGAGKA